MLWLSIILYILGMWNCLVILGSFEAKQQLGRKLTPSMKGFCCLFWPLITAVSAITYALETD